MGKKNGKEKWQRETRFREKIEVQTNFMEKKIEKIEKSKNLKLEKSKISKNRKI